MKKIILSFSIACLFSVPLFFPVKASASGVLQLSPSSATKNVGDLLPINMMFNTGGEVISSITFQLTYPYTGATPEIDVVNSGGTPISSSPFTLNGSLSGWSTLLNTVSKSGGTVTVKVALLPPMIDGYSTTTLTNLGIFYLKVMRVPSNNPTVLHFDPSQAKMLLKSDSSNILSLPSDGSYSVGGVTIPPTQPPTATPTTRPTSTPTLVPTITPTTIPSGTPTVTPRVTPTVTLTPTVTPTVVPGTADYTLIGPASNVATQTTFTVTVAINTGSITTKEAKTTLNFDGTKIWYIRTSGGGFLPSSTLETNANIGAGWTNAKLTKGSLPAPFGSGNLVTFTFKAVCAATSTIRLQSGASNNYVYKDITTNTNIYNGGTDSVNITATGTGQCGFPPTPTPGPSSTPTPTMTPSPTPVPPSLRLKVGWNKIIWPSGVAKTANQLPTVCPTAVNKRTIFSDFIKNYWPTDWSFVSGKTYYIKCTSAVPWQL